MSAKGSNVSGKHSCTVGEQWLSMGRFKTAIKHFLEALTIFKTTRDITSQMNVYFLLARSYSSIDKKSDAIINYKACVVCSQIVKNRPIEMFSLIKCSTLLLELDDNNGKGKQYAENALEICCELKDERIQLKAYEMFCKVSPNQGIAVRTLIEKVDQLSCNSKSDEIKVFAIDIICSLLVRENCQYEKAIQYGETLLDLAINNQMPKYEMYAYSVISFGNFSKGYHEKCRQNAQKSVKLARRLGDKCLEFYMLASISDSFLCQRNFNEALKHCDDALVLAEETKSLNLEEFILQQMGNIHFENKNYPRCIDCQNRRLKIAKSDRFNPLDKIPSNWEITKWEDGGIEREANVFLAVAYSLLGDKKKFTFFVDLAITSAKKMVESKKFEIEVYFCLGRKFQLAKKMDTAIKYYKLALDDSFEFDIFERQGELLELVSCLYKQEMKFPECVELAERCIQLSKRQKHEKVPNASLTIASAFDHLDKYSDCIAFGSSVLDAAIQNNDIILEGASLLIVTISYIKSGDLLTEKVKQNIKRALEIFEELVNEKLKIQFLPMLCGILLRLKRYNEATSLYARFSDTAVEVKGDYILDSLMVNAMLTGVNSVSDKLEDVLKELSKMSESSGKAHWISSVCSFVRGYEEFCKGHFKKSIEYCKMCFEQDSVTKSDALGLIVKCYSSLNMNEKYKEYLWKATIHIQKSGYEFDQSVLYNILAVHHEKREEYSKALEYCEKGLKIQQLFDNYYMHAHPFLIIRANIYLKRGELDKCKADLLNGLRIAKFIGNKEAEAEFYQSIGNLCGEEGDICGGLENRRRSLNIYQELGHQMGNMRQQSSIGLFLSQLSKSIPHFLRINSNLGDVAEAFLMGSLRLTEDTYNHSLNNDFVKTSYLESLIKNIKDLASNRLLFSKNDEALEVLEQGRARSLTYLMKTKYQIKDDNKIDDFVLNGLTDFFANSKCIVLFYVFLDDKICVWKIMKAETVLKTITKFQLGDKNLLENQHAYDYIASAIANLDERIGRMNYPEWNCDASSYDCNYDDDLITKPDGTTRGRIAEDDDSEIDFGDEDMLEVLYNVLVKPVKEFYKSSDDIIIIPESVLYKVPFAALRDPLTGTHLCEKKSIRIAPSLTSLEILHARQDYHSKEGALLIAASRVGKVLRRQSHVTYDDLPHAEYEVQSIAEILKVEPLIGKQAQKSVVIHELNNKNPSLVHFAGHGEFPDKLVLSPNIQEGNDAIPKPRDYLLTMEEIHKLDITAKLVVLSCCESGNGVVKSEGIIGLARAFLAAGVRAVLVALWPIRDKSTKDFMKMFYSHLQQKKNAAVCLQLTMRYFIKSGKYKPQDWAGYYLIGDDVCIDF